MSKRKHASLKTDICEKKHTLDSDEEDSDDYERENLNDSDIEGGEDGISTIDHGVKITPFNMKEELEEGHFDKDGHYHWNKEDELKDNWLNNIDWIQVEKGKSFDSKTDDQNSNSGDEVEIFNLGAALRKMLEYMQPKENVQKALQRLGKSRSKISTMERLKRKKAGIEDPETQKIYMLTELANEVLSKTGNMEIYQETYETIEERLANMPSTSTANDAADMYADDFEQKEKNRLSSKAGKENAAKIEEPKTVMWEYKWNQVDEELHGPFTTEKMLNWSKTGHFKNGALARKVGESSQFYSTNRIDFDLYL